MRAIVVALSTVFVAGVLWIGYELHAANATPVPISCHERQSAELAKTGKLILC